MKAINEQDFSGSFPGAVVPVPVRVRWGKQKPYQLFNRDNLIWEMGYRNWKTGKVKGGP